MKPRRERPDPSGGGFWEDLKRRRVVRVAAGYVAIAFATLEGTDLVFPRLGLPDAALTTLVILAVLGFPVALGLSWAFRLSSDEEETGAPIAGADDGLPDSGAAVRPARRPLRLAALAAATALFGLAAWWWIPRAPGLRHVDLDAEAIVVLPFDVRGGEGVAFLREGLVDLLSTKLDGVGGLRVVDPQATLAATREDEGSRSADEGRAVAARLGAGRAIQGSVVAAAGALQVRAAVHDVAAGSTIEASVEGPEQDLFALVDRLVSELVAAGVLEDDGHLLGLETLTTASNEALRLYLDGVRNHRAGRGEAETLGLLEQAVRVDTTFALAAYWAAQTAVWFEVGGAEEHLLLATRHQDRLGPRDRMRVAAALASVQGRYSDAIPLYRAFVERYPDDLVGWFRYAEELAHSGYYVGKPVAEARAAYLRAFSLDPGMAPLYYHMAHIGGLQGDSTRLRIWAAGLDSLEADPLWPAVLRLMQGLVVGDTAMVRAALDRYRMSETSIPAPVLAASLGELTGATIEYEPGLSERAIEDFVDRALSDTARNVASRRLVRLEAGLGRLRRAREILEERRGSLGSLFAQDFAWVALHPVQTDRELLIAARNAFAETAPAPSSGEAAAWHYMLGRLALRLDHARDFEREVAALRAFAAPNEELARFAGDLERELSAIALGLDGRPDEALNALLEATYWHRKQSWLGFPEGTYFDGRMPDRSPMFLRAELLLQAGRDVEAAGWYEVAADGPWHKAAALLALADIRERAGDMAAAGTLRRRARSVRRDADSESS